MSFLSKLFGGSEDARKGPEPTDHNGFLIYPDPMKDAGGFRVGARIEKTFGEEVKTHRMIRADTYSDEDTASDAAIAKAKIFIDQMGDGIFD